MKTVLIGQNAAGKSNFLEALVIIFKQLDYIQKEPDPKLLFEYEIIYKRGDKKIKIVRYKDPDENYKYNFSEFVGSDMFGLEEFKEIKKFKEKRDEYLPKYVFAYYSGMGNSNRLEQHFEDYKEDFAKLARNAKNNNVPKPARLLYAELIHSQLSLLSFFIDNDPIALQFLKSNLNIESFHSALLTIQKPDWSSPQKIKLSGDSKFFGSTGVVKNLLYYLHDNVAFAPLRDIIKPIVSIYEKKKNKTGNEAVHLYIDNFKKIQDYVESNNWKSFEFFHVLNTANVSHLLLKEGIKIRVKKKYATKISFPELSEGEQQLLTVLGLMRFTYTDEALFLLDEPDTHLNPWWRWKYMDFIDEIVLNKHNELNPTSSIQVIMTSHDPLTIGSLSKEEVRIFVIEKTGLIVTTIPREDPKRLGVAGILTSDIFGLPSTLPPDIYVKIEERKRLEQILKANETLTPEQTEGINLELNSLNDELDNLGYYRISSDPLYEKFQSAVLNNPNFKIVEDRRLSPTEISNQYKMAEEILNDILKDIDL